MTVRLEHWKPLAGVLAVVGMVVGFGISSNTPSTDDSDAKIASYYTSHSHQIRTAVTFFVFLAGVLFLLFFYSELRARIVAAETGVARLGALAYGAGLASGILWIGSIAMLTGPAFTANDTGKFHLDPNLYRLVNDTGYLLWVSAVIVGALVVWATSAVSLRTGILPRWFAWLGVLVGIIQLFAVVFIPVFVYWGWIVVAALLLTWRGWKASSATPTPAT